MYYKYDRTQILILTHTYTHTHIHTHTHTEKLVPKNVAEAHLGLYVPVFDDICNASQAPSSQGTGTA